ncbi:MAG: hypothetical protein ACMUIP_12830, partial [bacterium]
KKGEALAVLYKGDIDVDYLYDALNKSTLPKLWIPKKIAFFHVEEIPILGSGKLDLKKIKQGALNKIEEACRSQCPDSCMVEV